MKESSGVGEGASREALNRQRTKVIKSGTLFALLGAAAALAGNIFFADVQDYKRMRGHLTIEVDRGGDGTVDERQEIHNLIVNSGENFLVDAFQNLVEPEALIYHGSGTSTVAAAEGDVGLGAEVTTGLNPDSTRPSCSVVGEGAASNIRRCQATVSYDASLAITEWGLFNQASTAGGTMFSRVVFSAINVNSGDSIQFTWDMTVE